MQGSSTGSSRPHMSQGQFAEQLPMFMSAREIKAQFSPLEGDKQLKYDAGSGYRDETDDELWDRKLEETQLSKVDYANIHNGRPYYSLLDSYKRKNPISTSSVPMDTGESVWTHQDRVERIRDDEADDFINSTDSSLYTHLSKGGQIPPVHLGHDPKAAPGEGKRILGGHHRIAAMADIDPDRLITVLHTEGTSPHHAGHPGLFGGRPNSKDPYRYT